jgi:hypothetical protein
VELGPVVDVGVGLEDELDVVGVVTGGSDVCDFDDEGVVMIDDDE